MTTQGGPPRIDHVTIAGRDLDALEAAFERVGIDPEYGGRHESSVTHMSVVGFADGTYVELLGKAEPGTADFWDAHIDGDAGPCAWAVRTDDIDGATEALVEAGVAVDGPFPYSRDRPDGTTAEWKLTFPGEGEPGELLPFLIEDVTPRSRRVRPTPSAVESGLSGVHTVVIAVEDLDGPIEQLRSALGLSAPTRGRVERGRLAGNAAAFADAPVALLAPGGTDGWVEDRLERVGPGPCAFLFGDAGDDVDRFPVGERCEFGPLDVALLDPDRVGGIELLGIVDAEGAEGGRS
ncbi:VOC family protein [Halorarum halobium]|uniref:VOC family protein n=1 Tax=Halorarum halobium TaxID=3075121 RepID=UPI0028A82B27|nr:VOC family protein [Halobaculum sp. XH14]